MRVIAALLVALCSVGCAGHGAPEQRPAPVWTAGFVRLRSNIAKYLHLSAEALAEVPRARAPAAVVAGATAVAQHRYHDPTCLRFFRDGDQFAVLSLRSCEQEVEASYDHMFFVVGHPGWERQSILIDPDTSEIAAVCPVWRDRSGEAQGYPTVRCPTPPAPEATASGDAR
jgi:hypothetical protein